MTTANLRPSYSSGASAFERSESNVSIDAETVVQIAHVDAGEPAGFQAIQGVACVQARCNVPRPSQAGTRKTS
jgi:hypothetical protein